MLSEGKRDQADSVSHSHGPGFFMSPKSLVLYISRVAGKRRWYLSAGISDAGRAKPFPDLLTNILGLWGVVKGPLWLSALTPPSPLPRMPAL